MNSKISVAVFAYNRPLKLLELLSSLSGQLHASDRCTIFIDGPRAPGDVKSVRETISVARRFSHPETSLIIQSKNLGLAKSVYQGLDEISGKCDEMIVLEDDLVLAPSAISFFRKALTAFSQISEVSNIQGYRHPCITETSSFFLRGAGSWGWATWSDEWIKFRKLQLNGELSFAPNCLWEADFEGNYFYSRMLREIELRKIDSWAVPWHLYNFCSNRLALFPHVTQVRNNGLDGSGEHKNIDHRDELNSEFSAEEADWENFMLSNLLIPTESKTARSELIDFYRKQSSFRHKLLGRLTQITGRKRIH